MSANVLGPVQATVSTSSLPSPFCPTSEQDRLDTYASRTTVTFPNGYSTVVSGNAKPDETARSSGYPWLRYDSAGRMDRIYVFADGAWLAPHYLPVGSIMLWGGDITTIDTFDGGSATGSPPYDGPFWEEVTEAIGRMPVHPDTARTLIKFQSVTPAGGGSPINRIDPLSTGGEERHTLTSTELPDHAHTLPMQILQSTAVGGQGANTIIQGAGQSSGTQTNSGSNDQPHNNMPPFIGLYLIRRTDRTHYKIDP